MVCGSCDSTRLKALRIGVSRATEELAALLGTPAVEITGATDADVEPGSGRPLVVGTEAALHRVDHAGLVAFLDMDQHLLAPRFAAGEEALSVLARASRVVGTRHGGGRVLVQTRVPGHEALDAAVRADPGDPGRRRAAGSLVARAASLRGTGPAARPRGRRRTPRGCRRGRHSRYPPSPTTGSSCAATTTAKLADGLASVDRPAGRLRVEVDPSDA